MTKDSILRVEIDESGRLLIYPDKVKFLHIWRSGTEVHWDDAGKFLYSPKPQEWSYLDWYRHIVWAAKTEYGCELSLTDSTVFVNVLDEIRQKIIS